MEFKKAGVVGGGIMGAGIIHVLLNAGMEVGFKELDQNLVDHALYRVRKIFQGALKRGKITEDEIQRKMSSVRGFTDDNFLSGADVVIEAVPEKMDLKIAIFQQLDRIADPRTILASNSSSLSISQLGGGIKRPSKVIGMHWFNPPHVMKLIEVISGLDTSPETVDTIFELCKRLQKIPVRVKECAGFLVNRLLGSYVNEAIYMVEEGRSPQEVDSAAEDMGAPMGPIALGDMVGWDTIYRANVTLYEEYGSRFAVPSLLTEVYESGRLGAKAGKGFYKYEEGKVVRERSEPAQNREKPSTRYFASMINEGIRCLDENVASSGDIDTAMKVGAGMPKGPLQWADEIGLDRLLQQLMELKETYGERFLPSPLLKRKVAARHMGKESGLGFYQYG